MQLFDPKTKERHLVLQHVAFNKLEKETHTYKKIEMQKKKKKNHSYTPPFCPLPIEGMAINHDYTGTGF